MKKNAPSPDKLVRLARSASHDVAPEIDDILPPGLATRIASRWAAPSLTRPAAWLWERLSYAGLTAALLICAGASLLRPAPVPRADSGVEAEFTLTDLMEAQITHSDSGL